MEWTEAVVRCVQCGGLGLVVSPDRSAVSCMHCRACFAVLEDIPVVLPEELLNGAVPDGPEDVERILRDGQRLSDYVAIANRRVHDDLGVDGYACIHHREEAHQSRLGYDKLFESARRQASGATRAVDIGAGDCRVTMIAAEHFPEVVALDISHAMLLQSRTREDTVARICCAADNTPLADGSVDVVIAAALLHHLVDLPRFFAEVHRLLRPGGVLCTTHDPNYALLKVWRTLRKVVRLGATDYSWPGGALGALAEYQTAFKGLRPHMVRQQLVAAGFNPVRVRTYLTPATFEPRWQRWLRSALTVTRPVCPRILGTHFAVMASKP